MTITISKKDIAFCSVIAVLLIALSASALVFSAGGPKSDDSKMTSEQMNAVPSGLNIDLQKPMIDIPPGSQPHASCYMKLVFIYTRSDVYNGNNPYNLAFMGSYGNALSSSPYISTLQDINGDNLPDYVFAYNQTTVVGNSANSTHVGCVYLNNGNGWTKAYECYATTTTDLNGQPISTPQYSGDCAGTPTGKN